MIKAVLFDLDGTLLDTSEGIKHSVRHTIYVMGYNQLSEDIILKFVGPPIQNSLMTYCGVDSEEAQKGANVFRDFYKSTALYEAALYDGIIALLQCLKKKGLKIGVATYKREDYAVELLKHFGIDKFCDVIHGADNENVLTKADIVEMCINELSETRDKVVLIGDTEHDAKGAFEANVQFIAITWGFGYKKGHVEISYPYIAVVDVPSDVSEVINLY